MLASNFGAKPAFVYTGAMQRLPKAWKHLPLTKSRQKNGSWLKWRSEDPEDDGEPNKQSLENNCPMIHCMYEQLQSLDTVPLKPLMGQVSWLELMQP